MIAMPDSESIIAPLQRAFRRLVWATVVLFLVLVAVGVYTYVHAAQNTEALCALRGDLENRAASSQRFLDEHPNGVAGIPARTIREGLSNQRRTISALSGLSC